MRNQEVANILENIADLMEIKGGEVYRVRAYQRAAAEIDSLAENIEEICKRGELKDIPGIGESIASKVRDIINTGTTPAYEELKSMFPESLIPMLSVPGLGPRTVKTIYQKLGIKSVEELKRAAQEHRLSKEANLSAKTEADILRNIEQLSDERQRLSLGIALPLAEDVIRRLKESPAIGQISEAGSLRRRKDTIGDIDIVAETTDTDAAIETFTYLPHVRQVIETGPSMSSIWTKSGLRMDLRLTDAAHYGAMLHHFTGSKQHNIKLRGMARDRGLTINEYGIFRLDNGQEVTTGRTEDDIYRTLDMPWIPPELREDRGEIEASITGKLPNLVDIGDIKGDLHTHTRASDGGNTIEEMVEAARARGYSYIAICDHSKSLSIAHGLDEARLLRQIEEIHALNRQLKDFRVLAGMEVDIRANGDLDLDHSVLKKLDIVVTSLHQRYKQEGTQLTDRIVKAIETGLVDILAHPMGRIIGHREPYDIDFDRVFDAAAAHSTAMEINSYPDRLDLNDIYTRAAKERGLKLAIDTDAHNTIDLHNMQYGLAMARRGWLEVPDVLNAWSLDELAAWLEKRRVRVAV